jgi:hypothetical protein
MGCKQSTDNFDVNAIPPGWENSQGRSTPSELNARPLLPSEPEANMANPPSENVHTKSAKVARGSPTSAVSSFDWIARFMVLFAKNIQYDLVDFFVYSLGSEQK